MLLSSYDRLLRYLAGQGNDSLTDDSNNRRDISFWISSISAKVETYLKRSLETESKTEYFDVTYARDEYWVKNVPISSITSVKLDSSGLFDGSETTLSSNEYYIGSQEASVVLTSTKSWTIRRGLQIVYTGGLAVHGTQSIFAVADSTGWNVDKFCFGETSGAFGIIKAAGSNSLTIEILYGIFTVGETLTEYIDESMNTSDASTTLSSKTRTSLAESYPAIVNACEMQIRYMHSHRNDFENDSSERDGVTLRRASDASSKLQAEVRMQLDPYIIPAL